MKKKRRRFRQTTSLRERLSAFAQDIREEASELPPSRKRDDLLERARRAETAARIDEWARTPGVELPYLGTTV
jgi:hypothetical protein